LLELGKEGKAPCEGGFDLVDDFPVGKLTDRICGPVKAGGAFEVVPAPPDAHGVE